MTASALDRNQPNSGEPVGKFLGFPLDGFGFFTSLMLAASSGFFAFFLVTAVSIFGLLGWNLLGHHNVTYTMSYRMFGAPIAAMVWTAAFIIFGTLWARARIRQK